MLRKHLNLLPLVVMASATLLSSIKEPSEKQKGFKLDLSLSNGDSYADDSSYQTFDLARRNGGSGTLPLHQIDAIYSTELYMGSQGERLKLAISLSGADTWVMDRKVMCLHNKKREVMSKRDTREHEPQDSLSLVGKIASGTDNAKISGKEKKYVSSDQDISKRGRSNCVFWGTFDSARSKTLRVRQSPPSFYTKYIDDTFVQGVWASDLVGTSKTMMNLTFAVAKEASRVFGHLGVGLLENTQMKMQNGEQYANFPVALKNSGYIKRLMYSLYLNERDSRKGSILFGAVDHRKYVGILQTVPMINSFKNSKAGDMAIVLDKIYLENIDREVVLLNQPIAAMFEAAVNHLGVPRNVLMALVDSMSGDYWSGSGVYKVDCGHRSSTGNIVFEFSGIKIKVPVKDLVLEHNGICYLGVYASDSPLEKPYARLGNFFLRKAYFVADLEKKEISLAQASTSYGEDLVEVVDSIPGAVRAERYSSTSVVESVSKLTVPTFEVEPE